jgi:hypothetical protein
MNPYKFSLLLIICLYISAKSVYAQNDYFAIDSSLFSGVSIVDGGFENGKRIIRVSTVDKTFRFTAEDIKEYCEQHSLSNIILMGHSMGGKTAMLAAVKYSNLVAKLVVVDIAPKYYEPHHQQILDGLTALEDADLESRQEADKLLSEFISEKPIRLFLLKNLKRKSEGTYCLKVNLETLKNNIETTIVYDFSMEKLIGKDYGAFKRILKSLTTFRGHLAIDFYDLVLKESQKLTKNAFLCLVTPSLSHALFKTIISLRKNGTEISLVFFRLRT